MINNPLLSLRDLYCMINRSRRDIEKTPRITFTVTFLINLPDNIQTLIMLQSLIGSMKILISSPLLQLKYDCFTMFCGSISFLSRWEVLQKGLCSLVKIDPYAKNYIH